MPYYKAQYPKAQGLKLPANGDAEAAVVAPAVGHDEAAGADVPNNQLQIILLLIELLAACVCIRAIGIEPLPCTDVVHEDARSSF